MSLKNLIRKKPSGAVATATPATFATQHQVAPRKVAGVAKVAVATATEQKNNQTLSPNQERAIRRWLSAIGETDELQVAEVIDRCRMDPEALDYFLGRATKAVTCAQCRHFQRAEDHLHLGHCAKGGPEAAAGLWDTDKRVCVVYQFTEVVTK